MFGIWKFESICLVCGRHLQLKINLKFEIRFIEIPW
jgi:hypothetical protein